MTRSTQETPSRPGLAMLLSQPAPHRLGGVDGLWRGGQRSLWVGLAIARLLIGVGQRPQRPGDIGRRRGSGVQRIIAGDAPLILARGLGGPARVSHDAAAASVSR